MQSDESGSALEKARYLVIDTDVTGLNCRKDPIVSIGAVRMEGGRINRGDSFKHEIPLKGGDGWEILGEIVGYRIGGAIENVSPITGKSHAKEVTGRTHELSYVKVFGSSCRRVLIQDDSSRKYGVKESRRIGKSL